MNQLGIRMWPFSEMSLPTATLVGTIANLVLLASLIGGVLSTFVIVKTADIKEEHWAEDRRHSSELVAALTMQGEQLRKDTAEANAKALEAQLALSKIKNPRGVNPHAFFAFWESMKVFAGTEWDVSVANDIEPLALLGQIEGAIMRSEWTQLNWTGPARPIGRGAGLVMAGPLPMSFGGLFSAGTMVTVHPQHVNKDSPILKAAEALADGLKMLGVDCAGVMGMEMSANPNAVHLVIGRKL